MKTTITTTWRDGIPTHATPENDRRVQTESNPAWENITGDGMTGRLSVEGGWIVRTLAHKADGGGYAMAFVPTTDTGWDVLVVDQREPVERVDLYHGGDTIMLRSVWFTADGALFMDAPDGDGVVPVHYIADGRDAPGDVAPFRVASRRRALRGSQVRTLIDDTGLRPLVFEHWYVGDVKGSGGAVIGSLNGRARIWTFPTGRVVVADQREGVWRIQDVVWSDDADVRPFPIPFTLGTGLAMTGTGWRDAPNVVVVDSDGGTDTVNVPDAADLDAWIPGLGV